MRYLALILALALAVAGCGGSDDATDTTGATTTAATTTTTGAATTTTEASTTTQSDGDGPFDRCPELAAWAQRTGEAQMDAMFGAEGVQASAAFFQEWADEAPSEIKDDMLIFADAYQQFADDLDAIGIDFSDPDQLAAMDADKMAQLEAAVAGMDTAEVNAALDRIEAFFERECGS